MKEVKKFLKKKKKKEKKIPKLFFFCYNNRIRFIVEFLRCFFFFFFFFFFLIMNFEILKTKFFFFFFFKVFGHNMSPTTRLLKDSELESLENLGIEERKDGVVFMEISNVIGMICIAVWILACISIGTDTAMGAVSLSEGVANEINLPYNSITDSWNIQDIEWTPLVVLEFMQNGSGMVPPSTTKLLFTSTWVSGGRPTIWSSHRSYSCYDNCSAVQFAVSGKKLFRKGWRVPFGKHFAVNVTISALSDSQQPIEEEWKDGASLQILTLSKSYVNASSYLGCILFFVCFMTLLYYIYRCRVSAEVLTADQKMIPILLGLFLLHVPAIITLESALEYRRQHRFFNVFVTVVPYIFVHFLWGTVWDILHQQRPLWNNEVRKAPYKRCIVWTIVSSAAVIIYALRADDDENIDITAGFWDLVTGSPQNQGSEQILAGVYAGLRVCMALILINTVTTCRTMFRHAPYLVYRGNILKSKLFSVVAIACVFHELGSTGSFLLMISPITSTSIGSCAFFFGTIICLAICMLPAFKKNDKSRPPPPTSPWKNVVWLPEWRRWASRNRAAGSLYFFYYAKEEDDFWSLQVAATKEESAHSMDNSPLICTADRDFDDVFFKCIKILFHLLTSSRNVAVFMLMWPVSLICACGCWWAPIQHAQHLTLLLFNNSVVNLFSIPPLRHPEGLPILDVDMFGFRTNWRKICYLFGVLLYTPISVFLMFPPTAIAWIAAPYGVVLRWCPLTFPVGTLVLTMADIGVDFFIRWNQWIVKLLFLDGAHWDGPSVGPSNRNFYFHPFCVETCAMLTSVSYESYRSCPLISEPVDSDNQIGPLNVGGLLRSGLVSANAIGGRQGGNRDIDLRRHGLTLLNVTVTSGMQILFSTDASRRQLIIAFRGTSNTANKVADLDFMREIWSEMADLGPRYADQSNASRWQCGSCTSFPLAHRGFGRLWDSIKDAVHRETEIHMATGIPRISITGHSLGAALAVLCAYSLSKVYGPQHILVYSFGTPLLGNVAFARAMRKAVPHNMNVMHENDACTRAAGTWGNRHAGNIVRIGRCGQILVNPLRFEMKFSAWRGNGNPFSAHKLVKHQAALGIAAALHGVNISTRVGEETSATDPTAWSPGPSNGKYEIGSEVIFEVFNKVGEAEYLFGRVAGYRGKTTRLRTLTGPIDVPRETVKKPKGEMKKQSIMTFPFPVDVTTTYHPCDMKAYKKRAQKLPQESMTLLGNLEPSAPPAESVLKVPRGESFYGSTETVNAPPSPDEYSRTPQPHQIVIVRPEGRENSQDILR